VPILTWLNPSGVDAEAAATDQIDQSDQRADDRRRILRGSGSPDGRGDAVGVRADGSPAR
jgi:hypothetical protein